MNAVIFGWGLVCGYWVACSVVRHIERQPIKVKSLEFGSLTLSPEETEKVLAVLKSAVKRQVK